MAAKDDVPPIPTPPIPTPPAGAGAPPPVEPPPAAPTPPVAAAPETPAPPAAPDMPGYQAAPPAGPAAVPPPPAPNPYSVPQPYSVAQPGQPQPYGQPGYGQPSAPNGLSIASMILGIGGVLLAFVGGVGFFPALAAVITGHMASKRQPTAKPFWVTGLITGYIGIAISVIYGIFIVIFAVFAITYPGG